MSQRVDHSRIQKIKVLIKSRIKPSGSEERVPTSSRGRSVDSKNDCFSQIRSSVCEYRSSWYNPQQILKIVKDYQKLRKSNTSLKNSHLSLFLAEIKLYDKGLLKKQGEMLLSLIQSANLSEQLKSRDQNLVLAKGRTLKFLVENSLFAKSSTQRKAKSAFSNNVKRSDFDGKIAACLEILKTRSIDLKRFVNSLRGCGIENSWLLPEETILENTIQILQLILEFREPNRDTHKFCQSKALKQNRLSFSQSSERDRLCNSQIRFNTEYPEQLQNKRPKFSYLRRKQHLDITNTNIPRKNVKRVGNVSPFLQSKSAQSAPHGLRISKENYVKENLVTATEKCLEPEKVNQIRNNSKRLKTVPFPVLTEESKTTQFEGQFAQNDQISAESLMLDCSDNSISENSLQYTSNLTTNKFQSICRFDFKDQIREGCENELLKPIKRSELPQQDQSVKINLMQSQMSCISINAKEDQSEEGAKGISQLGIESQNLGRQNLESRDGTKFLDGLKKQSLRNQLSEMRLGSSGGVQVVGIAQKTAARKVRGRLGIRKKDIDEAVLEWSEPQSQRVMVRTQAKTRRNAKNLNQNMESVISQLIQNPKGSRRTSVEAGIEQPSCKSFASQHEKQKASLAGRLKRYDWNEFLLPQKAQIHRNCQNSLSQNQGANNCKVNAYDEMEESHRQCVDSTRDKIDGKSLEAFLSSFQTKRSEINPYCQKQIKTKYGRGDARTTTGKELLEMQFLVNRGKVEINHFFLPNKGLDDIERKRRSSLRHRQLQAEVQFQKIQLMGRRLKTLERESSPAQKDY